MGRFPFPAYPVGWYHLAYADDVRAGDVRPVRCFGRDLVCFRGESGASHVLDAHCPHLGAHIGYGGTVCGDLVACPFHGWRFDGEGVNVEVPYSTRTNAQARLQPWPVVERNGILFVWYHPSAAEPAWEPPEVPEYRDPEMAWLKGPETYLIRSHVQEMGENSVDVAHFRFVHGVAGFRGCRATTDGPKLESVAEVTFVTPRGDVDGTMDTELWGMGLHIVRSRGIAQWCSFVTMTPVEEELVEARYTFMVPRSPDGRPSRVGEGLIRDFEKQILQDIPIFEHKVHRDPPALILGDGPILTYRRWARQFYPELDGSPGHRDPVTVATM